ncbi:phage tail protein [Leclercia adecarboxylata]|uniref:phage tail-collar fiber domain-containing protein n=1 Tax=Leclercia adecarboxylata TaxID=83655 RepID=UPI003016BC91
MAKFKTIITTAGAAKIAAVLAGTASIVLDNTAKMAVGDGGGTLPTPNPAQTKLIREVHRASINRASIDASDPKNIVAELVIPPETGGFWIREMALYDAAGSLLAVGNMAETYKPSLSEGAGRKMVIRMVIAVSEVNAITITMDGTTVMATQDYVDSEIDKHAKSRNHPDATLTEKGFTQLNSATNSTLETQAATPKAVKTVMDEVKLKAPLASPSLTGKPTAPTAAQTVSDTQIATTAFVKAAIDALINSSPGVLDTLGELATALGNDPNFATTMVNALATKAPLASPALTGTPTAPTAAQTVSNTQIATTAYVKAAITALVNSSPGALDTLSELAAALGNDPNFATTMVNALAAKAPLASPALTGTPTAPTAAQTVRNAQIATTAYVKAAIDALVNSSPGALDTLSELAAALGNDPNFATTMVNALAAKAPLSSPALTGKPTAPTPPQVSNDTQIATTGFVTRAMNAIGLALASQTATAAFDWQQADFVSGSQVVIDFSSSINPPAAITYATGTGVTIEVVRAASGQATLRLTAHTGAGNNRREYLVFVNGAKGSRGFSVNQCYNSESSTVIPLTNGGLGATTPEGGRKTLGFEDMGIGLATQPLISSFDWQQADFLSGSTQVAQFSAWVNPPDGVSYNSTTPVSIEVVQSRGSAIAVRLTPLTTSVGGRREYLVTINGNKGSRTMNAVQEFNNDSSTVIPIANGGTGGKTPTEARTNLGVKDAALRDVGDVTNKIPDMSYFIGIREAKGYQRIPGGMIMQWGRVNVVTASSSADIIIDQFKVPFPGAALHCWATVEQTNVNIPCFAVAESINQNEIRLQAVSIDVINKSVSQGQIVPVSWLAIGY